MNSCHIIIAYQAPGGSDISSPASIGGTQYSGGGPIRLKPDFAPSTRFATQSHNCPFRTPHPLTLNPHLAFGIILMGAASSPDCVLARDPRQIAVPVTGRNSFLLPIIPQARNRMQLPRRHAPSASWPIVLPGAARIHLLAGRDELMARFHRSLSDAFLAHSSPAKPLHEATIYLYNHYSYL